MSLTCNELYGLFLVFQTCVSTHDKQMEDAVPCGKLSDLGDKWREYDVIGIDEGQFFPDLLLFAETVANAGKIVVISALDGTFQRKVLSSPHPAMFRLVCLTCFSIVSRLEMFATWYRWRTLSRSCQRFAPRVSLRRRSPTA